MYIIYGSAAADVERAFWIRLYCTLGYVALGVRVNPNPR